MTSAARAGRSAADRERDRPTREPLRDRRAPRRPRRGSRPVRAHPYRHPENTLARRLDTRRQRRIGRVDSAALFVRAPAARAARSAARTDRPSRMITPSQPAASARDRGHGEHRACVALRELVAATSSEDVVGELEQAQAVRDRRLRAADSLRDLAEREAELVDQHGVRPCLLDRQRDARARRSRRGRAAATRGRLPRGSARARVSMPASFAARHRRSPAMSS